MVCAGTSLMLVTAAVRLYRPAGTAGSTRAANVNRSNPGAPLAAPGISHEDHRGSRLFAGGPIESTRILLPWYRVLVVERKPGARLTEMATPLATPDPTFLTEITHG